MEFEEQTIGLVSIEQDIKAGAKIAGLGIKITNDGRIWICIDGTALLRFKPFLNKKEKKT